MAAHPVYRLDAHTELVAFHVEAALPHAPDGFWVYTFVQRGRRVGSWDWALDEVGLERIAAAYQTATAPDYEPPDWTGPDGEAPMIRPPIRDLVARAMESARPGPPPPEPRLRIVPPHEET